MEKLQEQKERDMEKLQEESQLKIDKMVKEFAIKRAKKTHCANSLIDFTKEDGLTFDVCENEKRHASKYCQECSDKYNK